MWAVILAYEVEDPTALEPKVVDHIEEQLGEDAFVAVVPAKDQITVTTHEMSTDPAKALSATIDRVSMYVSARLVDMQVMDEELYKRQADEPTLPELVSAPEVGAILGGISRQRVYQLQHESLGFPEPLYRLRTGSVWDRRAIERFERTWARKPGRPARPLT